MTGDPHEDGGPAARSFRVVCPDLTRPAEHVTPQLLLQRCDTPLLQAATRCAIVLAEAHGWSAATTTGVFYGLKAVLDGHTGDDPVPLSQVRQRVRPMTAEEIRAVEQAAVTPAQRLVLALAAVHAARPKAIRELTLDDIDLPSRRITIAGHRQRLGELTRNALLAWLEYRRATWPDTANRYVLVSRISALFTGPVSPGYLDKHQPRGISLERIRRDRILQEAMATGADPLHLALVFNIDHTNAMACANAARNLLNSQAERVLSRRPE